MHVAGAGLDSASLGVGGAVPQVVGRGGSPGSGGRAGQMAAIYYPVGTHSVL